MTRDAAAASVPLLQAVNLAKSFAAIRAVDGVSLEVRRGEVVGLVGENGAGKSTLIGMLSGAVAPDEGTIIVEGEERSTLTPGTARRLGVSVVYQELSLCTNLTVAENVYLGAPPIRRGMVDRRAMREGTRRVMAELGAEIDPTVRTERLRMAERQLTEVARALRGQLRVLILDEPTSSLSRDDFEILKNIIRRLQRASVGVIFVSHRLSEVIELAERVVVMRDGKIVGSLPTADVTVEHLAGLMVGRTQAPARRDEAARQRSTPAQTTPVLELRRASRRGKFHEVSLTVASGEIVGIAGLRGAGRHEIADAIYGLEQIDGGEIRIRGRRMRRMTPRIARRAGMAYLPQDRRAQGIVAVWDVRHNLALGNLPSTWGLIQSRRLTRWSTEVVRQFRVRPPNPWASILSLSGGNQQKVVLGRNLASAPSLLVALEPTRGVDVEAKAEIRQLILNAARGGAAVLLVDSELSDMLTLCDRMYVMHRGRMVGHLSGDEASEESVTVLAGGGGSGQSTQEGPLRG